MIFIVDDGVFCQFVLKKRIENISEHAEVKSLMNGMEALDSFKEILEQNGQLPNVVFLDINMPILDGWDVLDALVKLKPDINKYVDIYLCSTSLHAGDKIKAEKYNIIKGFLIKDIEDDILERIINGIEIK
jgi:CheY-like chemotaxis protein